MCMQTSGSHVNNLTAAFAALPCPDLPEAHAAAQAADARTAAHNGSTAAAAAAPFTQTVLSWTPGISAGARVQGSGEVAQQVMINTCWCRQATGRLH